jgi:hypothetical protein
MSGAGDILDIIQITNEPFLRQFGIYQFDQQTMVFTIEPAFFKMQSGDTDKTIVAAEKRVDKKQTDKQNQRPQ